jgi:hypothetical protein
MPELIPKLKEIAVDPFDLLLDPNNPRYFTHEDERVAEADIALNAVQENAHAKMQTYRIRQLQASMMENGYVPTDAIFVTEHLDTGNYLVREGNRRVTAIKGLLLDAKEPECPAPLRKQLSKIKVLQVLKTSEQDLERQLSYLLGVRHHGSLKAWSPFARAQNAFKHYLELAGQSDETFRWDGDVGGEVAASLSVDKDLIERSFRVYRVMHQIDAEPEVQAVGGINSRYYSLIGDLLKGRRKHLSDYFPQDPVTFRLVGDDTIERLDQLCHFSVKKREGAPVNRPQEWGPFNNILGDESAEKRSTNLARVEKDKEKPSAVWAERTAELKRLDWAAWLQKTTLTLKPVDAGQMLLDPGSEEYDRANAALIRTDQLITDLKKKLESHS